MGGYRAPLRVDLAGGWTDLAPYTHDHGGEVVNFTIDKWVTATLSGDGNVDFQFDVPAGSGLGTSGALNVAKIAALGVDDLTDLDVIAESAFEVENKEGNRCGRQDQWASAHGGFNRFLFIGDGVEHLPFEPAPSARKWLHKHLIIAHSGIQHKSGDMQELVWSRYNAGDRAVINGLHTIRLATKKMADALQRDQRQLVVDALNEICEGVDSLDPSIHQPFRSTIDPMITDGSVMAWKALGAGGGGCAALLCNPMAVKFVRSRLSEQEWQIIDWKYDNSGLAAI
jgi:D-glycero-alpha-D-manno-heptose-7-phosphate kinase